MRHLACLSGAPLLTRCRRDRTTFDAGSDFVDEASIAGYAAYAAFDRYLRGNDIFILPNSRASLEHMLYVARFHS